MNETLQTSTMAPEPVVVIEPKSGWQAINLKELAAYRDLFYFLVWRDIKVLYAQTILGLAWAVLNPLVQIVIFSIVFGKVAKIPTEGIPYILFSTVGIIPWTYMSESMSMATQSLISGQAVLGKVYFPRLLFPATPVLSKMVDFSISMVIVIGVCIHYRVYPTLNLLLFPLLVILMMSISASVGLWLSALAIRFRDVRHAMPFAVRMLMYSAPVVYSASSIPESYRMLYSLNPIVGVIEGFRACFLGTPIPWQFIWPSVITATILFLSGLQYFKRMEKIFVDVI